MRILASLLFLILSAQTFSSDACKNCTIKLLGFGPHYDVTCVSTSCVYVMMNESITNRPTNCNTASWHFTVDTSTDSGKGTLSALLSAYAMRKPINIKGSGSCNNSTTSEDLLYVYY